MRTPLALAALALTMLTLTGCGESAAHKAYREQAEEQAGIECTMEGAGGTGANAIYTDTFKNCQKDTAAALVSAWEAKHPGE